MTDRRRRLDPLSPLLLFPTLWTLGALLAQIRVLDFQGDWSAMAWVVIASVPIAFVAGGFLGRAAVDYLMPSVSPARSVPQPGTHSRRLLAGLVALGWLEMAHQFVLAGTVPLFSANIDAARTALPGGPTIALTNALAIAAIVALTLPRRLLTRAAVPEIAIAIAALAGYLAAGGRGTVLMPLVVALLARWAMWGRPPARLVLVGAIIGAAFFSALFYLRVAQGTVEPFDAELFGQVVPNTSPILVVLLPIYFALAMNFEALAAVVETFPAVMPYGRGSFDALGLDLVFTDARPLGSISADLTPPWLTSTLAGPLWADGGLVLVVSGLLVVGAATCASHSVARRSRELRHALVFGYVLFLTLFCVYQNVWTQQIDWVIVAPGLLLVGAYVTNPNDPPGIAGRLRMIRTPHMTPRRGLVAACVAALAVLAGAVVIAVSGMGVDDVKRSTEPDSGAKALRVNSSLALPTTTLTPESEFITDGDVPTDNEPLRAVASTGKGLTIDRYLRVDERRMARLHKTVGVTAPAGTRFDIAHWRQDDDGVLFMMRDLGRTIDIRGIAPTDPVRTIVRRRVPIERAETGTTRYLAIARWSGKLPDLFVIQRGSQLSRVRVTVFSGESGFSRRVLDVRAPLRGITPTGWDVDVGRADGARPDLILVRRGGRSRSPELHVLNGDDRFQSFLMQRTMRLPKGTRSTDRFVFGSSLGFPAVYAIDLSGSGRPKLKHVLLTR